MNKDTIIKGLDFLYNKALVGNSKIKRKSVQALAQEYLKDNQYDRDAAINSLIRWQVSKNATTSLALGSLGLLSLPAGIPSSLYIQLRMIATIACISGYDPSSDKVKTFVYASLVGDSIKDIFKNAGVEISKKMTKNIISSISGNVLTTINQAVGFRLITKFGEKGVINLHKTIPFAGGAIGAIVDGRLCYSTGKTAKKLFYTGSTKSVGVRHHVVSVCCHRF